MSNVDDDLFEVEDASVADDPDYAEIAGMSDEDYSEEPQQETPEEITDDPSVKKTWTLPSVIFHNDREMVIILDAAGITKANISIRYTHPTITISGNRPVPEQFIPANAKCVRQTLPIGEFSNSYAVEVPVAGIKATMQDGLLVVRADVGTIEIGMVDID